MFTKLMYLLLIYVDIYFLETIGNMAVRDILKTDYIDFLIYREKRGEFKGYKSELLTEETPDIIKKIIFCCQCGGISRKPRLAKRRRFIPLDPQ